MSEFGRGSEIGSAGDRQYEGWQDRQAQPGGSGLSRRGILAMQGFSPDEEPKETKVGGEVEGGEVGEIGDGKDEEKSGESKGQEGDGGGRDDD